MSMKGLALAVASIVLIACNGDSEVASEPTAASQSSPPPVATTAPAPSPTPSPAPESAPALDYESRLSGLEDAFHAMVDSYNETLRPHYEGYLAEIELAESTYDEGLAAAAAVEKADVAIINRYIASGPLRSRLAQLRHNLVEGQDYPMVYIGEAAEAHVLALKTALEIYNGPDSRHQDGPSGKAGEAPSADLRSLRRTARCRPGLGGRKWPAAGIRCRGAGQVRRPSVGTGG